MKKLELKHIAPYLPYGLEFMLNDEICNLDGLDVNGDAFDANFGEVPFCLIKPLLRPLSQLTEEIEHNGEKFVPIDILFDIWSADNCLNTNYKDFYVVNVLHEDRRHLCLDNDGEEIFSLPLTQDRRFLNKTPTWVTNRLLKWHFDVFGLIEQGLAIEKK